MQRKNRASGRNHHRVAGAIKQGVDDLDVDFAQLGDPSADDL